MGIDISGWVEAKLPFYEERGWQPVIDLFFLETLAAQYGDDHVRLVVWFSW